MEFELYYSCLEIGHFQGAQQSPVRRQTRIGAVDHWHDDITCEASVAEAEGEATSFKRPCGKRHLALWTNRRPLGNCPQNGPLGGIYRRAHSHVKI